MSKIHLGMFAGCVPNPKALRFHVIRRKPSIPQGAGDRGIGAIRARDIYIDMIAGKPPRWVAMKHGISTPSASKILNKRIYRDVTDKVDLENILD
jgi:hypothetical protein